MIIKTKQEVVPKISVCIPIYNGEKYIEKCIRSLFEQTLDDIEYVFVNDCTPDNSMGIVYDVMEEYPNRKPYIKIINHEINLGIAISNRDALLSTRGEYVITCDNDDWVDLDMYECLYNKAKEINADVVCCDYYLEYPNKRVPSVSHFEGDKDERVKAWIKRKYTAFSWATMVRGTIYRNQVLYITEGYAEDAVRACQVQFYANRYAYIAKPMYHYRVGGFSSTNMELRMRVDLIAYRWIIDFLSVHCGTRYDYEMNVAKLVLKRRWCTHKLLPEFYTVWPEVNNVSLLKDSSFSCSVKILLWLAIHKRRWEYDCLTRIYRTLKKLISKN